MQVFSQNKQLSVQGGRFPSLSVKKVKKSRKRSIRRGRKKSKTKNQVKMNILGSNAAGLLNKKESFFRNISLFNPGVYLVQESKVPRKGKVKHSDYVMFERVRKVGGGGGLLTAVHKNLNPVNVGDECDEEVFLTNSS